MKESNSNKFRKTLLGEPVIRPDGVVVTLWKEGDDTLMVETPFGFTHYSLKEVRLLGDGSFQEGTLMIGQAHYAAEKKELLIGNARPLSDELQRLKEI